MLFLLPVMFLFFFFSIGINIYLFFKIRTALIPSDVFVSGGTRLGNIMVVAGLFICIPTSLIAANLFGWCIPSLRKKIEQNSRASFTQSMRKLSKAILIISLMALPFWLAGIQSYFYVDSQGVHVNSIYSWKTHLYSWNDINRVSGNLSIDRNNIRTEYIFEMHDGTRVDLLVPHFRINEANFIRAFPEIHEHLAKNNTIQYKSNIEHRASLKLRERSGQEIADSLIMIMKRPKRYVESIR